MKLARNGIVDPRSCDDASGGSPRERLTAEGRWDACREQILEMAERRNEATDGTLLLRAEYLVVVGRKVA